MHKSDRVAGRMLVGQSEEPESPARVFLGLVFGLAFGGGRIGRVLGVRQRREVGLLGGTQALHQRLQLVLLQLEVQLHTEGKQHKKMV